MAKGNLIQGLGRGKLGDVVLYRANGEQLSRVRVRKIGNPNTLGQRAQRAVAATVSKMYSMGKAVFNHSFEGFTVPSGSQRQFMSANMAIVRSALIEDTVNQVSYEHTTARVVLPKTLSTVVNGYKISQGSLIQNYMDVKLGEGDQPVLSVVQPVENASGADYYTRVGIAPDDIFTLCVLQYTDQYEGVVGTTDDNGSVQYKTLFGYLQFRVKAAPASVTKETPLSDLFDMVAVGFQFTPAATMTVGSGISFIDFDWPLTVNDGECGVGIIRSREDSGLRSTTYMKRLEPTTGIQSSGITWNFMAAGWSGDGVVYPGSELVLEGADF